MLQKFSSNNDLNVFLKIIYYLYYNLKKNSFNKCSQKKIQRCKTSFQIFSQSHSQSRPSKVCSHKKKKTFYNIFNSMAIIVTIFCGSLSSTFISRSLVSLLKIFISLSQKLQTSKQDCLFQMEPLAYFNTCHPTLQQGQ